jgi:cytochrome c peroxidase
MALRKYCIVLFMASALVVGCKKDNPLTGVVESFKGFVRPVNFPDPTYKFASNPVTKEGFELGRALFYESRLSRNNTVNCGSCHIQSSAFTQHGHDVSHGIDDRLGTRNSPPIMNLAWNKAFMWGGGVFDLDLQPIVPITSHEEMDEKLDNVFNKLRQMPKYTDLFNKAFGSNEITTSRFMKALSQFMLMCISSNSKYDKVMRKEQGATFTNDEQAGYVIFKNNCASCHAEPLFTDGTFRNNGLAPSDVNDLGLYTATLQESDKYKFKVPSLRNLQFTAPYMHDGRFLSLSAVFTHYTKEVKSTPNIDPLLLKNSSPGITLSPEDILKLTAFLNTLNDAEFINNTMLAEQ